MAYRHELTPYSTWKHVKTNSTYTVLGISLQGTNGPGEHEAECVIYVSHTHGHLAHRDISEFLDGRFQPVFPVCVCGHSYEAHTGHTTMLGQKESTHCSQGCGCLKFEAGQ